MGAGFHQVASQSPVMTATNETVHCITVFPKPQSLSDQNFPIICEKLRPHCAKWRVIGEGLGFTPSELDTIKAAPQSLQDAPQSYLSVMLSGWLQWAPGDARGSSEYANIHSLKRAVDKAGLGRTAQELFSCLYKELF